MLGLPLAFTTPIILTALIGLPLLWYLLRLVPPRPRRIAFAPTRLLLDLPPKEETPARMPWWLTLLRLFLAALVIFAAAGPIWNPPAAGPPATGPVVLLIDSGWPAASTWEHRRAAAEGIVADADLSNRGIILIPTGTSTEPQVLRANEARDRLRTLVPVPYVPDRTLAFANLEKALARAPDASVVYLSDGTTLQDDDTAASELKRIVGAHPIVTMAGGLEEPLALAGAENAIDALSVAVLRTDHDQTARAGTVRALDMRGLALGEAPFGFEPGARETRARFDMPVEIRNEVARIEIAGQNAAGAVQLLDERWRRRTVGLVSGVNADQRQPLLAPSYYLSRALGPFADVRTSEGHGSAEAIGGFIDGKLPVIVLSDIGTIPPEVEQRLQRWMEGGGVLVRFAGPRLANTDDRLVPVTLRRGGRTLGGSLSWEQPQKLGSFSAEGPFRDIAVPNDVTVRRQVLAEPDGLLASRTWAALTDGTPLVTGESRGKGMLVLFHVTADTTWSDLPLSGAFVEMLRRVVALSGSSAAEASENSTAPIGETIAPSRVLDGFGAFSSVPPTAKALPSGFRGRASADHPPGFYGPSDGLVAVNALLPTDRLKPLDLSELGRLEAYRDVAPRDLRAPVLVALFVLLVLDALIVFLIGGGLARLRPRPASAASLLAALAIGALALSPLDARAQTPAPAKPPAPAAAQQTPEQLDFAIKATSATRLAYVLTGDAETDEISRSGLKGLTDFLGERTALEAGEPMGVDPAKDELSFFPLLYWPVLPSAAKPSAAALARIDAFMKQGGTILFDTRDAETILPGSNGAGSPANDALRAILSGLDIPELEPVPRDHVLTKAFYLLRDFPGRFASGQTFVEALPAPEEGEERPVRAGDGVSPIIITSNDLAGAWAVNADGQSTLPVSEEEPRQRELAFRAGVNMVMYVLTGNYKADQVHVPALLERLGQ